MTEPTNPATGPRVFKYADKTFPDPGSQYTTEQVLQHLRTYFPELGHAKTEEKTLPGGTVEITFSKQVTRKGADSSDDMAIGSLLAELEALEELEDPLAPIYDALAQTRPLTLATLRPHSHVLREGAERSHRQSYRIWEVIRACKRISPVPLPQLPWGF